MWWIGGHAVMFFFLFSDFYVKAYLRGAARVKVRKLGVLLTSVMTLDFLFVKVV